jgi:hypothetical protein
LKSSFGERLELVDWVTHKAISFVEIPKIKCIDKNGVLIKILKVVSERYGVNINKMNIETNVGIFVVLFILCL